MTEEKTYEMSDLKELSADELQELVSLPGVVIKGTAVVRDKYGQIKEDRNDIST